MDRLKQRFPFYSKLLYLFPAGYRKEYAEQMLQTLADMLDDPEQHKSAVWARTALDFPLSVTKQQLTYTGAAMTSMPFYIKQNARVGAWLFAPFFVFVIVNNLWHDQLQHSIVWHVNILFAWIVVFPSIAILLNLAALLRWIQQRRKDTGKNIWQVLTDVRYSWPAVSVLIIGLGILALVFGHDSVHCIGGNPFTEITHRQQTIQCLEQQS